jgi:hypothetical protein
VTADPLSESGWQTSGGWQTSERSWQVVGCLLSKCPPKSTLFLLVWQKNIKMI